MVIPSLLAHAANGEWCVTAEELQKLQVLALNAFTRPRADYYDYLDDGPEPAPEPMLFTPAGRVAIVRANGVLGKNFTEADKRYFGCCDYDDLCEAIDAAEADPATDTILLHARSPGGMVIGLPECADRIAECTKNTVAYSDFAGCSAMYWLMSQCDAVYTSLSSVTGSIGVLAAYTDYSQALDAMGIRVNAFSAGKWKLAGASFKPMTDEERAMFQSRVERAYGQFVEAVSRNRTIPQEAMEGQGFDGEQAVVAGLSDGIFPSLDDLLLHLNNRLTPRAG
jgi:signal peptide peptidase SppA